MTGWGACGDDGGGACGDDNFYSCHPGLEPGSPKQSGSGKIAFLGDPRLRACGDDGVVCAGDGLACFGDVLLL